MRVFKFWRVAETTALIDGTEKSISCFGGSNRSEADALADGQRRLEAVKRRIAGVVQVRYCPPSLTTRLQSVQTFITIEVG